MLMSRIRGPQLVPLGYEEYSRPGRCVLPFPPRAATSARSKIDGWMGRSIHTSRHPLCRHRDRYIYDHRRLVSMDHSKIWFSRNLPSPRSLVSPPCLELNTPPDATFARLSNPISTSPTTGPATGLCAMSPFLVSFPSWMRRTLDCTSHTAAPLESAANRSPAQSRSHFSRSLAMISPLLSLSCPLLILFCYRLLSWLLSFSAASLDSLPSPSFAHFFLLSSHTRFLDSWWVTRQLVHLHALLTVNSQACRSRRRRRRRPAMSDQVVVLAGSPAVEICSHDRPAAGAL